MPTAEEKFAENVLSCVDDLNAVLPRLATRYEDLVIIAALAEHVGGALRIFMHAGICNAEQARRVLAHVEDTAFARGLGEEVLELPESMQ
jgi:aminoglycoside phosphotransferase (APT) family kinase protein